MCLQARDSTKGGDNSHPLCPLEATHGVLAASSLRAANTCPAWPGFSVVSSAFLLPRRILTSGVSGRTSTGPEAIQRTAKKPPVSPDTLCLGKLCSCLEHAHGHRSSPITPVFRCCRFVTFRQKRKKEKSIVETNSNKSRCSNSHPVTYLAGSPPRAPQGTCPLLP